MAMPLTFLPSVTASKRDWVFKESQLVLSGVFILSNTSKSVAAGSPGETAVIIFRKVAEARFDTQKCIEMGCFSVDRIITRGTYERDLLHAFW